MTNNTLPALTVATDVPSTMTTAPSSPVNKPKLTFGKRMSKLRRTVSSIGRKRSKTVSDLSSVANSSPFASIEAQNAEPTRSAADLNSPRPRSALKSPRHSRANSVKSVTIDAFNVEAEDLSAEPSPATGASESALQELETSEDVQPVSLFKRLSTFLYGPTENPEAAPSLAPQEDASTSNNEEGATADHETDADAAPATPSPDQETDTPVFEHPGVTLGDAFDYAFSKAADIKTAQQLFRDACADHVYPVNSYSRQGFIGLLKDKLRYRARFASKEFFQVFMNISAFVHQYVDPGLDQEIAATFAQAQKGSKGIFVSWQAPRMHCKFNNGMHAVYLCYLENTRMLRNLPEPGTFVELYCMQVSAKFNSGLIEAAGDRVDSHKVALNLQTSDMWESIQMKREHAVLLARQF